MIETFLGPHSLPFAVAIGLMFLIALIEVLGVLIGLSPSDAIDSMLPEVELDLEADGSVVLPDTEVSLDGPELPDAGPPGPLSLLLGWLCVGRVPILILLVVFLTAFGLIGFVVQGIARAMMGTPIPALLASVPAFAGALPVTRISGLSLARLMPKEQTEAVSVENFIGKVATITQGEARRGLPAEAKLTDRFGQAHYIRVEPDNDGETFPTGSEVIVVRQASGHYRAIANTSAALTEIK